MRDFALELYVWEAVFEPLDSVSVTSSTIALTTAATYPKRDNSKVSAFEAIVPYM